MNKVFPINQIFDIKKVYGQPQKTYEVGTTPYVTGAKDNNGVVGFVKADETSISKGNCISVDPITGLSCYQPVDFVGRGFSGASINLLYNDNLDEKTALFMCSAIEKVSSSVAAYTNLFNSTRLANAKIIVPVIENSNPNHEYTVDDIDWQYMRDRITELERDRITELDAYLQATGLAYLQATGLNDYELTEDDKKILSAKRASDEDGTLEDNSKDEVRFGKFVIGEIFKSQNGDTDLQKTDVNGKGVPIITSGVQNNGILGLSDREAKVINANTITVDMFGNAYFRDFAYKMVTHARVFSLELKEGALSDGAGLYICSKLKHFSELFSYNNMCSFNKIKSLSIELPIKSDGTPDFEYMERYIRAIEKVVIADVVKYKDKVIETTKKVVGE